jgi:Zn-dependent peptidase ImmA (M78 family)
MAPRYKEARRKAVELLKLGKTKSAPVNVEKLAKLVQAKIHYEPLDDQISGLVTRTEDGTANIGVNKLHASTRQRFTIAHEIGHLLLHEELLHVDQIFPLALRSATASMGTDSGEIEANQFAAELLMPAEPIEKDVDSLLDSGIDIEKAVEGLAKDYKVSPQAMTIRLSSLGFLS